MMRALNRTNKRRTLIFGIDGGTWDVIEPLMKRGVMPCLAQLNEQGAWGDLVSVVPVNSAAAWSSILTGMPPEKHGIYDFFSWHPVKKKRTSVNATWLPRPTLLDLLGQTGRVLALKIPMTYPPWPISGKMVSGLPTPDDESAFTYPSDLAAELNPLIEKGSAYRARELNREGRLLILRQLKAAQRSLERMTDHLLKDADYQTCFVVARDIDELQHFFWDVLSGKDEFGYRPLVDEYFRSVDQYLARMLDWAGEDARVILLSDHGFGPVEGVWHLNDWLRQKGFLSLIDDYENKGDSTELSFGIRVSYAIRRRVLRQMKRLGMKGSALERSLEALKMRSQRYTDLGGIDWHGTLAYVGNVGEEWLPVYINLQGREPHGIVTPERYESVREDLRQTLDKSEEPAVLAVHRAEEIFDIEDPKNSTAPDLLIETISSAVQSDFGLGNSKAYESIGNRNGCHRRKGMFLLAGPDVAPQQDAAHLLDIPATILAWQGCQVPRHFCGRVLQECIPEVTFSDTRTTVESTAAEKEYLSEEEEAGVRQKLESLGYL